MKKSVLKNFGKFIEKHLKRDSRRGAFLWIFAKYFSRSVSPKYKIPLPLKSLDDLVCIF